MKANRRQFFRSLASAAAGAAIAPAAAAVEPSPPRVDRLQSMARSSERMHVACTTSMAVGIGYTPPESIFYLPRGLRD